MNAAAEAPPPQPQQQQQHPPPPRLGEVMASLQDHQYQDAASLEALLTQTKEILSSTSTTPDAVVSFIVFFLREALPSLLDGEMVQEEDGEEKKEGASNNSTVNPSLLGVVLPFVEDLLCQESSQQFLTWCILVALSDALVVVAAAGGTEGNEHKENGSKGQRRRRRMVKEAFMARGLIIRHLEFFFDASSSSSLATVVRELASTENAGEASANISRILQSLSLLPLRLGNLLEGPVPSHLTAAAIFESLTREVLATFSSSSSSSLPPAWPALWGALVHKACKMGQTEVVVKVWVDQLFQFSPSPSPSPSSSAALLVEALPLPALEPILTAMVQRLTSKDNNNNNTKISQDEQSANFIRSFQAALQSKECGTALRTIFINKLLLSPRVNLPRAAALLIVRLLTGTGAATATAKEEKDKKGKAAPAGSNKIPSTLLKPLVQAWKERHFIQATDLRRQEYITYALAMTLAECTHTQARTALEREDGLVADLLDGVSTHLGSALEAVRLQGMRVAEAFAGVMEQDLRFEELEGKRYEDESYWSSSSRRMEGEVGGGGGDGGGVESKEKTTDDVGEEQGEEEEELEDGDLLEPLDLSDDEADLATVVSPRYLRRTIEFLRAKDEDDAFDRHTSALHKAEELVRSRPADLPDLACVLARELLTLENRFNMDGFASLREKTLVALIAMEPARVAPMLAQFAFDKNMAFGTRLELLDLLMEGARDLSGVRGMGGKNGKEKEKEKGKEGETPAPRVQGKRSLVPAPNVESNGTSSCSSSLASSKTRRWGYRRGAAPKIIRNEFGPVAARAFFRPLVHEMIRSCGGEQPSSLVGTAGGAGKEEADLILPAFSITAPAGGLPQRQEEPQSRLWARDSDQALALAKTIHALATFVECSGHSPGTAALAEDLLVLAWPMKNSVFPELRRAVLLSVACAMSYLNLEAFLARGGAAGLSALQSMTAWTATTAELDPDGECRKLAKMLVGDQQMQQQHLARFAASI